MDTDTLRKKYDAYISELKDANAEQEKVIRLQDRSIDALEKLLEQKEEQIALLTADLEKTMAAAKEMAQIMDSFFQD